MAFLFGTPKSECSGFAVVAGAGRQQNKEHTPRNESQKTRARDDSNLKKAVSATTAKKAPPNDSGAGFCLLSLRGRAFSFCCRLRGVLFFCLSCR